jgi:hypothetical protein
LHFFFGGKHANYYQADKKSSAMTEELKNQCQDPTESLTIQLPCRMVDRIERYAKENGMDIQGVLIEAVDCFLRKPE